MRDTEHTRQLIIRKALPIFNTKGYSATSISDITKATGITKGAIYGNFENKDAVAVAAFEYADSIVMSQLRERIGANKTAPLKLKSICQYFLEYIKNPPILGGCPIINTSIESDDNHPMLRMKVVRSIAMIKDSVRKIVNRGIIEQQLKRGFDVDQFTHSFYATITGAIMVSRVEGDERTYEYVLKNLVEQIDALSI